MGSIAFNGGHFRKLWNVELEEFRDHLLRLSPESRHLRFGAEVSDTFIEDYASHALDSNCRVWGFFGPRGNLRGTGELKSFPNKLDCAEAAFTVEDSYRGQGVGSELLSRIIRSARNRDIHHLYLNCLSENLVMQNIARKFQADLTFDQGDVVCDLKPSHATALTRLGEVIEDSSGLVYGVLDLQHRWVDSQLH